MQVLQVAMMEDLRSWRRRHDLTQPQMAEALGISLRLYCDVEAGRKEPRDKEVRQAIQACLSGAFTAVHDGERWVMVPSSGPHRLADDARRLTVAGALRRAEADTGVPVVAARVDEGPDVLTIIAQLEDGWECREVRRPDGTTRTVGKPATVEAVAKKTQDTATNLLTHMPTSHSMAPMTALVRGKADRTPLPGGSKDVLMALGQDHIQWLDQKAADVGTRRAEIIRALVELAMAGQIEIRLRTE